MKSATTYLKLTAALILMTTTVPTFASDVALQPMAIAFSSVAPVPSTNQPSLFLKRVQSNYRDRCVMNCKVSYNICREGRGRHNNNVCVQELNECLPGC
ncbi:hypothetical protein [Bradyrhizobium sp. SYSU BS000235]|uniref:hypothetical protein n=1 Tax=Bradyrhizobium sp. SYSU BS000235 TaxID=3411332 RepID=UPI003C722982